jgi:hypothetical protein
MRTNRITLAAALSIVLAILPCTVAAQAADETPPTPSYWTSTETDWQDFVIPDAKFESFPWGYRNTVGFSVTQEASDPRASGDITVVYAVDQSRGDPLLGRGAGRFRLVNEGGAFEGTIDVIYFPDDSEFRMALAEGKDGYEGLTLAMTNFLEPGGEGQPQGLIWEGELLPPDADLLPA